MKKRLVIDVILMGCLILLMSYNLIGELYHEVIGVLMAIIVIVHHCLNKYWVKNLKKHVHYFENCIVFLLILTFIGSMISGILISRHLFSLNVYNPLVLRMHMLCAYWGFILMAIHLGLHFKTLKHYLKPHKTFLYISVFIVLYGLFAFFKRDILGYLTLKNLFFMLGDHENVFLYCMDYMTIMYSIAFITYFIKEKKDCLDIINRY